MNSLIPIKDDSFHKPLSREQLKDFLTFWGEHGTGREKSAKMFLNLKGRGRAKVRIKEHLRRRWIRKRMYFNHRSKFLKPWKHFKKS